MNDQETKGAFRAVFAAHISGIGELARICGEEAEWLRDTDPTRLVIPRTPEDFAEMALRYEAARDAAYKLYEALNHLIL